MDLPLIIVFHLDQFEQTSLETGEPCVGCLGLSQALEMVKKSLTEVADLTQQIRLGALDLIPRRQALEEALWALDSCAEDESVQAMLPGVLGGLGLAFAGTMLGIFTPANSCPAEPGLAALEGLGLDSEARSDDRRCEQLKDAAHGHTTHR
jgi:hypothetical protein